MTKGMKMGEILAFTMIVLLCPAWLFKGIILGLFIVFTLTDWRKYKTSINGHRMVLNVYVCILWYRGEKRRNKTIYEGLMIV